MRYKIEFELPDNDTVLKEIKQASVGWTIWGYSGLAKAVPSIDAVKHGIWIEENTRTRSSKFYCSVCHRTAYDPQPTRIAGWVKRCRYAYCPNCGAKMDKEGDKK